MTLSTYNLAVSHNFTKKFVRKGASYGLRGPSSISGKLSFFLFAITPVRAIIPNLILSNVYRAFLAWDAVRRSVRLTAHFHLTPEF